MQSTPHWDCPEQLTVQLVAPAHTTLSQSAPPEQVTAQDLAVLQSTSGQLEPPEQSSLQDAASPQSTLSQVLMPGQLSPQVEPESHCMLHDALALQVQSLPLH